MAGQENYRLALSKNESNEIEAILIAFDLTKDNSLDNLIQWLNEAKKTKANIPLILVGTKIDLINKQQISAIR